MPRKEGEIEETDVPKPVKRATRRRQRKRDRNRIVNREAVEMAATDIAKERHTEGD